MFTDLKWNQQFETIALKQGAQLLACPLCIFTFHHQKVCKVVH